MELDDTKECVWVYPNLRVQYFLRFAHIDSVFTKFIFGICLSQIWKTQLALQVEKPKYCWKIFAFSVSKSLSRVNCLKEDCFGEVYPLFSTWWCPFTSAFQLSPQLKVNFDNNIISEIFFLMATLIPVEQKRYKIFLRKIRRSSFII